MATEAQVRYAKGLLARCDRNVDTYPIDKDTPVKAASWLIDKLKNGEDISPFDYEDKIKEFSSGDSSGVPKTEGGAYNAQVFNSTIAKIHSPTVRSFLVAMIGKLPGYFYHVPASSTGKYHPSFALGDGGLVRHTLAALRVADDLLENESINYDLPLGGADMVRAAITIHDGWKQGLTGEDHTTFTHPLMPRKVYEQFVKGTLDFSEEQEAVIEAILSAIDSHMGEWNTSRYEETVLPKPANPLQRTVHLCDYMASRKYLSLEF